jgi:hypothetical protein
VLDRERVTPTVGEKRAELNQVAAVGIDRVTREAALLLEIGQEVEHVLLEGLGGSWQASAHSAPVRRRRRESLHAATPIAKALEKLRRCAEPNSTRKSSSLPAYTENRTSSPKTRATQHYAVV